MIEVKPVARMLVWHGPSHYPIPPIAARTFEEFPVESSTGDDSYWRDGEALHPQSTIDALQARIAELEKGAERWKWWRQKYDALTVYDCANRAGIVLDKVFVCSPELMDRVTDAAIAKENSNVDR